MIKIYQQPTAQKFAQIFFKKKEQWWLGINASSQTPVRNTKEEKWFQVPTTLI